MRTTSTRSLTLVLGLGVVLLGCSSETPETTTGPPADDQATATSEAPAAPTAEPGEGEASTPEPDAGQTTTAGPDAAESTTAEPDADEGVAGDGEPPELEVTAVASGLSLPWDVQHLPDGTAIVSEREGRLLTIPVGDDGEPGQPQVIAVEIPDFFAGSEAGLMGLAVSPDFEEDRTVLACFATQSGGTPQDVRVAEMVLSEDLADAEVGETLIEGMPITSGRHAGCRLLVDGDTLYVGTGDAADETNPQDLDSLGGKVLATTLDGEPLPEAPFLDGDPRVLTSGHRNVQGLAVRPGTGEIWEVEHGPDVDDEVNVLEAGGNYGWDPGPGYDEFVPMTDLEAFPDAVEAVFSTGEPTHAMSGAVFLEGEQWGGWEGALAIAELKDAGITVLTLDGQEVLDEVRMPGELDGDAGRLRSLTLDADGALWVSTSDGEDDRILRVTPTAP